MVQVKAERSPVESKTTSSLLVLFLAVGSFLHGLIQSIITVVLLLFAGQTFTDSLLRGFLPLLFSHLFLLAFFSSSFSCCSLLFSLTLLLFLLISKTLLFVDIGLFSLSSLLRFLLSWSLTAGSFSRADLVHQSLEFFVFEPLLLLLAQLFDRG